MSFKLKVLLCGSPNGEKTKLVNRFIQSKFDNNYKMTVGVDIFTKDVKLKDKQTCTLSIWDIGNSQRFKFIRSSFYRGAACAVLVFDLTREATWDDIQDWYQEIKSNVGEIPVAFVGNHIECIDDTENETKKRNKFRDLVESTGNFYYETSSNGDQVEDIFSSLAERTVETYV